MKPSFLIKTALALLISAAGGQSVYAQGSSAARLDYNYLTGNQTGANGVLGIAVAPNGTDGPYMQLYTNDNSSTDRAGSVDFIAGYNATAGSWAHNFYTRTSTGGYTSNLRVMQDGSVQIGLAAPTTQPGYKLSVDGKIVTKALYVTAPNNWADFVFAPTYKVMSLPELEKYLQLNKHLPAIPSASEVETKGYSVTEMDAKLLQSVEELTLHVIELSKQNTLLAAQVAALQAQAAHKVTCKKLGK